MSNQIQPSIGRIVIFTSAERHNGETKHPAIITRVWTRDCVNLTVFPDAELPFPRTSVVYDEAPEKGLSGVANAYGSWSWPERV